MNIGERPNTQIMQRLFYDHVAYIIPLEII